MNLTGIYLKSLMKKRFTMFYFLDDRKIIDKNILNYLKENNIKILECGPHDDISNTFEKLNKLINQSKIV